MRTTFSTAAVLALALAVPTTASAKVAINRAIIVAVHAPGSPKGGKYGAVTFTRLFAGMTKKETLTTPLTAHTQPMTRLGDKEREPIALKDLKPGMVAVIAISGGRIPPDDVWKLDMLHVLGSAEDADPALAKILADLEYVFAATVTRVGPPSAERQGDLGQVEALWGKEPYIFRITKRTQIVWQAADGKRTPATLDDVKTASVYDVGISFPAALAAGDPAVVPATLIMLNPRSKKPR